MIDAADVTRAETPTPTQKPSVGRIVHYTFFDRYGNPATRPAIVTRVWNDHTVNLQVFTDGEDDHEEAASGVWRRSSVTHNQSPCAGFWSWPPRT